jgi:hypothetical protein
MGVLDRVERTFFEANRVRRLEIIEARERIDAVVLVEEWEKDEFFEQRSG